MILVEQRLPLPQPGERLRPLEAVLHTASIAVLPFALARVWDVKVRRPPYHAYLRQLQHDQASRSLAASVAGGGAMGVASCAAGSSPKGAEI